MKNFRDQTEDENVFAFVLRGAAERFDGESGDRHADVNKTPIIKVGLDVVRIVKEHAAFFQKADVVLIAVLVKRDEEIGFVAGGEDFACAHADLEDRWFAGNGGGERYVSHDELGAAAGASEAERCAPMDAGLGIYREA